MLCFNLVFRVSVLGPQCRISVVSLWSPNFSPSAEVFLSFFFHYHIYVAVNPCPIKQRCCHGVSEREL